MHMEWLEEQRLWEEQKRLEAEENTIDEAVEWDGDQSLLDEPDLPTYDQDGIYDQDGMVRMRLLCMRN
jgi:hypothetical protein